MVWQNAVTIVLGFVVITLPGVSLASPDESPVFVDRVLKSADGTESKYVVYIPRGYTAESNASKRWPVILFLHGAGERGDDGKKQVTVGLGPALRKRESESPFVAIFPQCRSGGSWRADSPDGERAMTILSEVEKEFRTDPDRIYLSGLSMGGMGTWSLSMKYPDRFAALVPICGRGDIEQASKIAKLPIWCFHGDADRAVTVEGSRTMIAAIKEVGGNPKYTEYPGVGHNSWDAAYATPELFPWLLEQRRTKK